MENFNVNIIALAISLVFSSGAMAHNMTDKDSNTAGYKSTIVNCTSLTGNLYDICIAKINISEKPAMEELNDNQTGKTDNQERAAKKERCDDEMDGSAKEICTKGAKLAETAAAVGEKPLTMRSGASNAFQACAKNMQANIAAFRARFLLHNAGTHL